MSSGNSSTIDQDAFEITAAAIPASWVDMASGALLLYEYSITISQEVELIWQRKLTGPSFLYLCNRSFILLFVLATVLAQPDWTTVEACKATSVFYQVLEALLYLIWAVFSGLRVYAISGRGRMSSALAILVVTFMLAPVGVVLYTNGSTIGFSVLDLSAAVTVCFQSNNISATHQYLSTTVAIASLIAGDITVLSVTWWKTYSLRKQAIAAGMKSPLLTTLLRDGTLYFLGMLVLNTAYLITSAAHWGAGIDPLIAALTTVIISRFLLNLRQIDGTSDASTGDGADASTPWVSYLRFRVASTLVGNMGMELNGSFGIGTQTDDVEEEGLGSVEETETIQEVPRSPATEVALGRC